MYNKICYYLQLIISTIIYTYVRMCVKFCHDLISLEELYLNFFNKIIKKMLVFFFFNIDHVKINLKRSDGTIFIDSIFTVTSEH